MDVLVLCELVPMYILVSHQGFIHHVVGSMACSLRHIIVSSPLGNEENSLAGLILPEHYISSVVWRIGRSIRVLRSFGDHRILSALCFCALGIGMVSILHVLVLSVLTNISPIDLDLKFEHSSGDFRNYIEGL